MYTQSEIDSILYQSYVAIGDIALDVTRLKNKGVRCDSLYERGYCLRNYMSAYERGTNLTDKDKEALLKCMIEVSQIREYPASAPILYREAPTVNIGQVGPAGPQGQQGEKGDTGDTGATGATGPQGIEGPVGADGPTGATGSQGIQGIQGEKGDTGDTGATGGDGAIGPQGPTGADGDKYATSSVTSTDIPTTHPTSKVFTVDAGLAYTGGQQVIIFADSSNYFIAQVTSYVSGSGTLNVDSISHVGSGTFAAWTVNLNGAPGPQGRAFVVTDPDITLDAALVATVEGGSYTPVAPYVASVFFDARADKNSPAAISGNMDGHTIQYNGADWADNGIWRGPQGIQGDPGPTGATGSQGIQGIQGDAGAQGIQGIQGVKGDQGDPGPTGATGATGATGPAGPDGPQGIQGVQGPQGLPGAQGDTGPEGPQGVQGDTGQQGIQGPAGTALTTNGLLFESGSSERIDDAWFSNKALSPGLYTIHLHPTSNNTNYVLNLGEFSDNAFLGSMFELSLGDSANAEVEIVKNGSPQVLMFGLDRSTTNVRPILTNNIDNVRKFAGFTIFWYGSWFVMPTAGSGSAIETEWTDRSSSSFTPALTPSWSTTGAQVDTGNANSKDLLFTINMSAFNNGVLELDIELQSSSNASTWSAVRGWRYKPDIQGSSTYAIPFTMLHSTNTTQRYFRVRVRRANNNAGTHRDTLLWVKMI